MGRRFGIRFDILEQRMILTSICFIKNLPEYEAVKVHYRNDILSLVHETSAVGHLGMNTEIIYIDQKKVQ